MSEPRTPENSPDEDEPAPVGQSAGADDLEHGGPTEQEPPPTQTEDERHSEQSVTDPAGAELGGED